jgi:hypothetical protein
MSETFERDIAAVSSIKAIPTILDIVCRTTGMRFAAVARVTEDAAKPERLGARPAHRL